jgi:hypothetical protein
MSGRRYFAATAAILLALLGAGAQQKQEPAISFGGAQVSLGMTAEQVTKNLGESARQLHFIDKGNAVVRINGLPEPEGDEGQVFFDGGRVVYASLHLPAIHNATELAQEIAGAVENIEVKMWAVSNYSSHGTGRGFSETIFDCGLKSFDIATSETFGSSERYTSVEITIGTMNHSK